ncbi:MAG TPA: hypothetical protein VHJ77_01620 [Vicinamibacterales bacterium]|jgi:hypothetical protein|nr:hypothetical protein [Vicinamibacterales bacterium]
MRGKKLIVLALGALGAVALVLATRGGPPSDDARPTDSSGLPLSRIEGGWQRIEGGYVLEIRKADAGGRLEAAYFNPRPIHVAKATAADSGGALRVFVELRDEGYPGATYALTYDPEADRLFGLYTQPAAGQTFEVRFTRVK